MIFEFWGWHLGPSYENEEKSHCLLYFSFSKDIWFPRMAPGPKLRDWRYISMLFLFQQRNLGSQGWHLGISNENEEKSHCLLYFCFSKDVWGSRIAPWHLLWEWRENSLSAIFLFQQRYLGSEDGTLALEMRMKRNLTVNYNSGCPVLLFFLFFPIFSKLPIYSYILSKSPIFSYIFEKCWKSTFEKPFSWGIYSI